MAVADAGLTLEDIDGLATYPGTNGASGGASLSEVHDALRLDLSWHGAYGEGPAQLRQQSRVAATGTFQDEMREAARSPRQAMGERRDKADRPESPVPPGFGAMASSALLRGLRIVRATRCALRWQMTPSI